VSAMNIIIVWWGYEKTCLHIWYRIIFIWVYDG